MMPEWNTHPPFPDTRHWEAVNHVTGLLIFDVPNTRGVLVYQASKWMWRELPSGDCFTAALVGVIPNGGTA